MRIWLPSELAIQKLDTGSLDQLSLSSPFFIGRESELRDLTKLVLDPKTSLVSIVGLGGIGKSRLALEIVKNVKGKYQDGVYFISFASINNPNLIYHQIADELQLAPHVYYDLQRHLKAYLKHKKLLIILDNFESLISNFDQSLNDLSRSLLSELLLEPKELNIVVTSRESLGIQKEYVYELKGLPYPKNDAEIQIEQYPAVDLFINEAKRLKPYFKYSQEDITHLASICKFVEGLPLGIKLAASWVKTLSLKEICDEMAINSNLEAVSISDIPARHKSMGVVFDQSWDKLSEEEKKTLMALSVFKGGASKDAILKFDDISLVVISKLIDKSLVQVSVIDINQVTRYDLHELLKQFVRDKLEKLPTLKEKLYSNHSKFFLEKVAKQAAILHSGDQFQAFKIFDPDLENIRQAWIWADQNELHEEMNAAVMVLGYFYDSRGLIVEGSGLFDETIDRLIKNSAANLEASENERLKFTLLKNLLIRQGLLYSRLSKYSKAKHYLEKSLDILKKMHGTEEEEAFSLNYLGHVEMFLGDYHNAKIHCEKALRVRKNAGDLIGSADVLINIGFGALLLGDFYEAKAIAEEIVQISLKKRYKRGLAIGLGSLGIVGLHLGDFESAKNDLERSLKLCKEINLNWFEPWFQTHYAEVLFDFGHIKQALNESYQAKESIKIIGDQFRLIYVKNNLAKILIHTSQYDEAYRHAFEAHEMAKDIQHAYGEIASCDLIAKLALIKGLYDEAEKYCSEAMQNIEKFKQKSILSSILRTKAQVKNHENKSEVTHDLLKQSISNALEIGEMPEALSSMFVLSKILLEENAEHKSANLLEIINGFNSAPFWVKKKTHQLLSQIRQTKTPEIKKVKLNKPINELIDDIMN